MVLPPLVEWLRVATVFTETRFSTNVEKDDVFQAGTSSKRKEESDKNISFQAARILLPGADFPPRGVAFNFDFSTLPGPALDELDFVTTVRTL